MSVLELLAALQAQHEKATAQAGELRDQIEHLTTALAEIEARLADLATTRKVIASPNSHRPKETPKRPRRTALTRPS